MPSHSHMRMAYLWNWSWKRSRCPCKVSAGRPEIHNIGQMFGHQTVTDGISYKGFKPVYFYWYATFNKALPDVSGCLGAPTLFGLITALTGMQLEKQLDGEVVEMTAVLNNLDERSQPTLPRRESGDGDGGVELPDHWGESSETGEYKHH